MRMNFLLLAILTLCSYAATVKAEIKGNAIRQAVQAALGSFETSVSRMTATPETTNICQARGFNEVEQITGCTFLGLAKGFASAQKIELPKALEPAFKFCVSSGVRTVDQAIQAINEALK